ncbi:YbhB/YbcL family Raf kinase inhibitor-like protein [Undibacterium luofuense]|uniref:YbhB/YbcL family Raf kinase inhibitor-like protein n=1 Tax=Undibacterium luofuense TaxID=2828733 RepID=A0A941I4G3_9BURK|nr:YbhB/YbcL family Raf kinase inhibitor-like protein [Undibacterium luofuense]MBR7781647.1 YbhB/YbcL family Raf kinase inhibitor-like protein [Undibacterium luofuense]
MRKFMMGIILAGAFVSAHAFDISSSNIENGKALGNAQVFNGFGCSGANVSPQVSWSDVPAGTKSFAITMYDPDAPTGSGWWHWTVVNIPKEVRSLAAGAGQAGGAALPKGAVMGRTDFGAAAFGGACPPPGDKPHRYQLTVWALNTDHLDLNHEASGALVGYMLRAHALGQASLTGYYGR